MKLLKQHYTHYNSTTYFGGTNFLLQADVVGTAAEGQPYGHLTGGFLDLLTLAHVFNLQRTGVREIHTGSPGMPSHDEKQCQCTKGRHRAQTTDEQQKQQLPFFLMSIDLWAFGVCCLLQGFKLNGTARRKPSFKYLTTSAVFPFWTVSVGAI